MLMVHFDQAKTEEEIRWRAIFGLMVCTGCRQTEARCAKVEAITTVWGDGGLDQGENEDGRGSGAAPADTADAVDRGVARDSDNTIVRTPTCSPAMEFEKPISGELVRLRWSELRTCWASPGCGTTICAARLRPR